ncbi:hypothetical protein N7492_009048 [Penicillium capsulatum]|uniref:Macro domain-containing protein n=1 Tax=Penicillium capsulatum TaxID=69766 RepID=A0A9W9HTX1_9EURO|nr:hypothetical protein N7492_009048 [Penicillium capsulatum]KAJ6106446.1 hypothetical protein N7512_009963 [Penicillium capsulatum]
MLCRLLPSPRIPADILDDIDTVIAYQNSHHLLTSTTSIQPTVTIHHRETIGRLRIACWKGDITTLTDVTAIVNAANSQLLGCFQPEHRCIDNVIHSAAGPRLRDACYKIMSSQNHPEPTGAAKVTPGFLLPAQWIVHTVGPQLHPREKPQSRHKEELASCYRSCLEAVESLPPLQDGRKVVAFCCISTGLFAFPSELAAEIAVHTVVSWYMAHPKTTITDIIFDTFLEKDWSLYQRILSNLNPSLNATYGTISLNTQLGQSTPQISPCTPSPAITKARTWLSEATTLIISAGAGLSAATGLDYTSTTLFTKHFPAFTKLGLRKLYDVFGYRNWASETQKWGYYFLHLDMVRSWPDSSLYASLRTLATRFGDKNYFIRTSNADGFFVQNGFDAARVATPQGQYAFLQCLAKCRDDAVFPSDPFIDRALPFIDPVTQVLRDETCVPRCRFCGGEVTLCVRGGAYFNERPSRDVEDEYCRFLERVEREEGESNAVVLELGVGLNTPAVLRWPNEDLVSGSAGRRFRLIRVGVDAAGCVPWELEEQDLAVGLSGDIRVALGALLS